MRVLNTKINSSENLGLYSFTNGIEIDSMLFEEEIFVQKEWGRAIAEKNIVDKEEEKALHNELDKIREQMQEGVFQWRVEDEDIHMNIERALTEELDELGKKIHIGRSRNDLIATTLRLFVKSKLNQVEVQVEKLIQNTKSKADEWGDIVVPGMTHVQSGMPISLKLSFGAHAEAFKRDLLRLSNAKESSMETCPMGSAAFAGTHLQIDLAKLASNLGFENPVENSYDSVGDRDFILEALNSFSLLAVQISRLCEELIYFSSSAVHLFKLPPELSTGSSIMPNKRNPDVLELARARMAMVVTSANEGAGIVKTVLPSYGSDFHELKKTFVRSAENLLETLQILPDFVAGLDVDRKRAKELCGKGHILATDLTNFYCDKGMSFREAYKKVAILVEEASAKGLQVQEALAESEQGPFGEYLRSTRGVSL